MEQTDYIRENIAEASSYILSKSDQHPQVAVILGSGMSSALPQLESQVVLPYKDIPHFPLSLVAGHQGELVCGKLAGKSIIALLGRFHFYEGYTMKGIGFPVWVLAGLGIDSLVLTSAAGGINRSLRSGDFMLVEDHLNLMGANPLIGPNDDSLGPRFINMTDAYDPELLSLGENISKKLKIDYRRGVLAAVTGPNYETKAELNYLARIGADAVTMSAVPEVIVARHARMRVMALALITNIAGGKERLTHDDVLESAHRSTEKLKSWLREVIISI